MKLNFSTIIVIGVAIFLAYLVYKHYNIYGTGHVETKGALADAPNASTYANTFYGPFNPLKGTKPSIPETVFDTKA